MSQTINYKDLCQVTIRHGYYLDNGTTDFDSLTAAEKQAALRRFDVRTAVDILPTDATEKVLRNHRILSIRTNSGLLLKMQTNATDDKPLTGLADETCLVYLLVARNTAEFTYATELTDARFRMVLLTNFQPAECTGTVEKMPFLADATRIGDTFLLSEANTTAILNAYVSGERPAGIIGILLVKTKGVSAAYDLLDGSGAIKSTCPQFKIHFDAKKTFWKYKKTTASFVVETKVAYPLTKYGFIDIDPENDFTIPTTPAERQYSYPNPSLGNLEMAPPKTYSVIFI